MAVYLLHFQQPMSRGINGKGQALTARHYLGFTSDLDRRLQQHANGHGSRLMQVCRERGIGFVLARSWNSGDRNLERQIKHCKNSPRLCPICNPGALNRMSEE